MFRRTPYGDIGSIDPAYGSDDYLDAADGDEQDPLVSLPSVLRQSFVPSPRASEGRKGFRPMSRPTPTNPVTLRTGESLPPPADDPTTLRNQPFVSTVTTFRPAINVSALLAEAARKTARTWTHAQPTERESNRRSRADTDSEFVSYIDPRNWKPEDWPFANFESYKKPGARVSAKEPTNGRTPDADTTAFSKETYEIYKNRVATLNKVWFPTSPSTSDEPPATPNTSNLTHQSNNGVGIGGASKLEGRQIDDAEDRQDTPLTSSADHHFDAAKRRQDNSGRRRRRYRQRRPHGPQGNGQGGSQADEISSQNDGPSPVVQDNRAAPNTNSYGSTFKPALIPTYAPQISPVPFENAAPTLTGQTYSAPQSQPAFQAHQTYHPPQGQQENIAEVQPTYSAQQVKPTYSSQQAKPTYSAPQAQQTYSKPQAQPTYAAEQAQPTYAEHQLQQQYSAPQAQLKYSPPPVQKTYTSSDAAQPAPQTTQSYPSPPEIHQPYPAPAPVFQNPFSSHGQQQSRPPTVTSGQSYLSVTRTISGGAPGSPDVVISHHAILPSGAPPGQLTPAGDRTGTGTGATYASVSAERNTKIGTNYDGGLPAAKSGVNYANTNDIFQKGDFASPKSQVRNVGWGTESHAKNGAPTTTKITPVEKNAPILDIPSENSAFNLLEHIFTTPTPAVYDDSNEGAHNGQPPFPGKSSNTAEHPPFPTPPSADTAASAVEPPIVAETAWRTGSEPVAVLPQQHETHILALVTSEPPTEHSFISGTLENPGSQYQADGGEDPTEDQNSPGQSEFQHEREELEHPPTGAENEIPDSAPGHQEDQVEHDHEHVHHHNQHHHPEHDFVYAEPELQVRRPPRGRRPGGWRGCRRCTRRRPQPQRHHRLPHPPHPHPHHNRPQRRQEKWTLPNLFTWPIPSIFNYPERSFRRGVQRRRYARSAVDPEGADLLKPEEDQPRLRSSRGRGRGARLFDGPLSVPLSRHSRPFLHTLRPQVSPAPEQEDFVALSTPSPPSLRDAVPVPVTQRHTAGPTVLGGDNRDTTTPRSEPEDVTTTTKDREHTTSAPQETTATTAASIRKTAPVTPVPRPATSAAVATTAQRRRFPGGAAPSSAPRPLPGPRPKTPSPPIPRPGPVPLSLDQFRQYLASGRPASGSRAKTYFLSSKPGDEEQDPRNAVDDTSASTSRHELRNMKHDADNTADGEDSYTESPGQNVIDNEEDFSIMKFLAGFPTPTPTVRPEDATVSRPLSTLLRPRPTVPSKSVAKLRPRRPNTKRRRPTTKPAPTTNSQPRITTKPTQTTPARTTTRPHRRRTTQVKSRFAPRQHTSPRPSLGRDQPGNVSAHPPGPKHGTRRPKPAVLRPHSLPTAAASSRPPRPEELRAAAAAKASAGGTRGVQLEVLKAHLSAAAAGNELARRPAALQAPSAVPAQSSVPTVSSGGLSQRPAPLRIQTSPVSSPHPVSSAGQPGFRPARWYRGRDDIGAIGERVITQVAAPQLLTARRRSW